MLIDSRCRVGLVLVAVLMAAGRADAFASYPVRDARVTVAGYRVGLVDMNPGWNSVRDNGLPSFTLLDAGPVGMFPMPFDIGTATYAIERVVFVLVRP